MHREHTNALSYEFISRANHLFAQLLKLRYTLYNTGRNQWQASPFFTFLYESVQKSGIIFIFADDRLRIAIIQVNLASVLALHYLYKIIHI